MNAKILIVEDDIRLAMLLKDFLEAHNLQVMLEDRGDTAGARILQENPDVVVLDWMLPGLDGLEVCKAVRTKYQGAIIMLTARRSNFDQVVGLEMGADDYVLKPVEPRVLLARIKNQLRLRSRWGGEETFHENAYTLGPLCVDVAVRAVTVHGKEVPLTSAEFDLILFLAQRSGQVITREELYRSLRGIEYDGLDRGMDIHVSRIRRKLRVANLEEEAIKAVRGVGYFMVARLST